MNVNPINEGHESHSLTHPLGSWGTGLQVARMPWLLISAGVLVITSLVLTLWGIDWGLPSSARAPYYGGGPSQYDESQGDRLYQTAPYDTYHPDETATLNALSNMNPSALDFNPRYFNYPSLNIYLTGAVLQVANMLGRIDLQSSKAYYVDNPDAMGRIIQLGRYVAVAYSLVGVILLWLTAGLLLGWKIGFLSGFLLAIMPLWVRNSHFNLVNIPYTTWMILVMFLSVLALRQKDTRWLYVGAIASGFAASTKYNGALAILGVLFVGWLLIREANRRFYRYTAFLLIAGLLATAAFFLASPYILLDFATFQQDFMFEAGARTGQFDGMFFLRSLIVAQGTILALFSALGIGITLRKYRQTQYQLLLVWLVVGLTTMLISDQDFIRYLIPALPILAIMGAIGIATLAAALGKMATGRSARPVMVAAIVAFAIVPTLLYTVALVRTMLGPDIRLEMSHYIHTQVPVGTTIYIQGGMYFDEPTINIDRFQVVSGLPSQASEIETQSCLVTHPGWSSEGKWLSHLASSEGTQPLSFRQQTNRIFTYPVTDFSSDWTITDLELLLYCTPQVGLR